VIGGDQPENQRGIPANGCDPANGEAFMDHENLFMDVVHDMAQL
jgi:hypothetical protein